MSWSPQVVVSNYRNGREEEEIAERVHISLTIVFFLFKFVGADLSKSRNKFVWQHLNLRVSGGLYTFCS